MSSPSPGPNRPFKFYLKPLLELTAEPIKIILVLFTACLSLTVAGENCESPALSESEINFRADAFATQFIFRFYPLLLVQLFHVSVAVTILALRLAKCLTVMLWSAFWIFEGIVYQMDASYFWFASLMPVIWARGTKKSISTSGRAIICLLFLLLAVPAANAMHTPPTVDQYNSLRFV